MVYQDISSHLYTGALAILIFSNLNTIKGQFFLKKIFNHQIYINLTKISLHFFLIIVTYKDYTYLEDKNSFQNNYFQIISSNRPSSA